MAGVEVHREPFVHLVDVAEDRALVAWGAFFFRRDEQSQRWEVVDDQALERLVGRRSCIGHCAEPYGAGVVEVVDRSGAVVASAATGDACWVWVEGLQPDTEYHYRVLVDGVDWAPGERWDWAEDPRGGYDLRPAGRSYHLRFSTWPPPDRPTPEVRFAALGDYGVGTRSDSESSRRQRRVGEALERVTELSDIRFVLSLGDNIYQGEQGAVDDESGGEDDDWYSSFFQPYRYLLARVPFLPAIGNHDTTDTEGSDDRAQMEDNFHIAARFRGAGRDHAGPGLFYRVRYGADLELVAIDTSQDPEEGVSRHFLGPEQRPWLEKCFAAADVRWRIPFSHHPAYCAGPEHDNDTAMVEALVPLFHRGGVRLVLAGHEHNFQIGEVDGVTYVVSGSGGKVREELPQRLGQPGSHAWAAHAHLLLVEIAGDTASLTPISGLLDDGAPHLLTAQTAEKRLLRPPFVIVR